MTPEYILIGFFGVTLLYAVFRDFQDFKKRFHQLQELKKSHEYMRKDLTNLDQAHKLTESTAATLRSKVMKLSVEVDRYQEHCQLLRKQMKIIQEQVRDKGPIRIVFENMEGVTNGKKNQKEKNQVSSL